MECLIVGNHTQGLGVVRSLGRMGINPTVAYDKSVCLSRYSKYIRKFVPITRNILRSIYDESLHGQLVSDLMGIVPEGERWVLFGVSEDIIHFFYKHELVLRGKFHFPKNDILKVIDKYQFAKEVVAAGVDSPKTMLLEKLTGSDLVTEYVAKGRLGNKFRSLSNIKGITVSDQSGLDSIRSYIEGKLVDSEVIIQEVVRSDSPLRSSCGFAVEGQLLSSFVYEKVRQVPDDYGTGSFAKSVQDSVIVDMTAKILKHLNYTGIFEIEFMEKRETGEYSVIEMNPRTWKCIDLAVRCGNNLCHQYADYLANEIVPKADLNYAVGVKWAHLLVDVVAMLGKRRFDYDYDRDMVFCDYASDDIMPFLAELFLAPLIKLGV